MEASNGFWKRSRQTVARALLVLSVGWLGLGVFQQAPSSGILAVTEARAAQSSSDNLKAPNLEPKAPSVMAGNEEKANAGGEKENKAGKEEKIKPFAMVMSAIAGLVLFLYGVTQLAQGLGDLNSERMRAWTARFTSNRFAGVGTGIVATTLLESSSVTIIMTIAMVSGGILTFVQSLGVVLGANIGTAVGAQIIALEFEQYVPILMLAGLLLRFIGKSETRAKLGLVLLGFGLMFYGLEAIDDAVKPLRDHECS
jgi:phosphate:Na+ symporter